MRNNGNKVIFWDFDGTLSYPNQSFSTALFDVLTECGYAADREKTVAFLEKAYSWKMPDITYPDQTGELWWNPMFERIDGYCTEIGIERDAFERIHAQFQQRLTAVSNYRLYDDTVATLQRCAELGYRNYLATNNYPEIVRNIELLGLAPYLDGMTVSSLIGYEKPRAEFYARAKSLSGPASAMYMIGDNPVADIKGGAAAGMTAIAVHECKNSSADYYAETLTDIFAVLK